jgi:hypothetical protein
VSLDERYVVAYHHCRRCARSIRVLRSSGPMDSATTGFSGPLFYAIFRSMAHHFRRFRKMVSSRSWSLTASYSTGPQIRNRCALLFLGSPGAWFFAGQIGQGLNSYPVKGTLGHLLSSPARRIPDRWSASHWLTRLGRSPHSPQSLTKRESGGKESKAKYCPEFELKGMVCG